MLQYEWYDQDPQLARDCLTALTCLSKALFPPSLLSPLVSCIKSTSGATSWKTRSSNLDFLQTAIFNNFMLFCNPTNDLLKVEVVQIVQSSLQVELFK